MLLCKMVSFLYGAIPPRLWRDGLLRIHIDKCSSCQSDLATKEEARSLLASAEEMGGWPSLWPQVAAAMRDEAEAERKAGGSGLRPSHRDRPWRAAAGAAALIVALASFLLWKDFRPEADLAPTAAARFELEYVRVGGHPAEAVIYRPANSDLIVVWVQKRT